MHKISEKNQSASKIFEGTSFRIHNTELGISGLDKNCQEVLDSEDDSSDSGEADYEEEISAFCKSERDQQS